VQELTSPAVPIRRSVQPGFVVCLECGFRAQMLRQHLRVAHGFEVAQYRTRWSLPADHPITAPAYSARRSRLAKEIGLGRGAMELGAPGTKRPRRRSGGGAHRRDEFYGTLSMNECWPYWRRVRRALLVAIPISGLATSVGHAMAIVVAGDQLILTGAVVAGDYDAVESNLSFNPQIKTIILRNSPGGDAPTGYRLGELFREKSLQTAVSGYCYSSCSRLFLGGKERYFTDDYPPEFTQIGFHGHYDNNGNLNAASVNALHLKEWIIRYSDGKADDALVERWINIPRGIGLIHFYNPASVNIGGYSSFMCQGTEPDRTQIFDCERISKNALDLGIATSLTPVTSHDQQKVRATILETPLPSGFAEISDVSKVPGISEAGRQQYRRFLAAQSPRAFALSPSGNNWAWFSSLVPDAAWRALVGCSERAKEQCQLYAVDDTVVWTAPVK
jgi:ROS/MUCR transcriptional regulator protein